MQPLDYVSVKERIAGYNMRQDIIYLKDKWSTERLSQILT